MKKGIMPTRRSGEIQPKAAEDSRTPRRWRVFEHDIPSARSWSAAVLCRFVLAVNGAINLNPANK
jgi:hypothetical protein